MSLEMCPTIEYTCCPKEDQLSMYTNWIHNNEAKTVEVRYKNLNIIYSNLLVSLAKVTRIAEKTKKRLMLKRVANCKILAERVLAYQIEKISSKIRENLNNMEKFFVDTYQGFYCAICDHENHQYFNFDKKEITYSEKFCRDIVQNTLPTLLFFHVEVVKYFNLVSKFLTACDYKGDYKLDSEVKKDFLFTSMPDTKHTLSECRNYRNHKSWFVYCKDICEKFRISEFEDFFEPNIDKIEDYTEYLETLIMAINNEEVAAPKDLSMPMNGKSQSKKKKKVRLLQEKENQDNPDAIFKSGLNSKVKLETFKTVFYEVGLSLYDEGRNCLINTEMFNQIKTTLHLTKPSMDLNYVPPVVKKADGTKVQLGTVTEVGSKNAPGADKSGNQSKTQEQQATKPSTSTGSSSKSLTSAEKKMLEKAGGKFVGVLATCVAVLLSFIL